MPAPSPAVPMDRWNGTRRIAFALATSHALLLVGWLAIMPRGFPLSHPQFWTNTALPAIAVLALVLGCIGIVRKNGEASRAVLAGLGGAWFGAALLARLVFPAGAGWPAMVAAAVAVVSIVVWRGRRSLIAALLCAIGGAAVPLCERGADPDTRPLHQAAPPGTASGPKPGAPLEVSCGKLSLFVDPMLRFLSTSPERGWTILTPFAPRLSEPSALLVERRDRSTHLTAYTTLEAEVYSHLNHFTHVMVSGHSDLRVSFSATPGFVMPVEPVAYPTGRPSRFAYLGADDRLHVVEASSAEKGPFHELASGPLAGGVLELTLHDGAEPHCRIALDTWAAQASRALSPTAGWGLPENAIEFLDGRPNAAIVVSLAATSVGRGWDSVGHRAGTYVNRLRIESVEQHR